MTKEVKIGLIGIAALAMLIYGINYLKGINMFQSANYYYVEYTNINGLAGSSPVFANGFKVGTVRSINYNYKKPGHVTVEVASMISIANSLTSNITVCEPVVLPPFETGISASFSGFNSKSNSPWFSTVVSSV